MKTISDIILVKKSKCEEENRSFGISHCLRNDAVQTVWQIRLEKTKLKTTVCSKNVSSRHCRRFSHYLKRTRTHKVIQDICISLALLKQRTTLATFLSKLFKRLTRCSHNIHLAYIFAMRTLGRRQKKTYLLPMVVSESVFSLLSYANVDQKTT